MNQVMIMMNCFLWNGSPTEGVEPYFHPEPPPEFLTIADRMPRAGFEPAQNLSLGFDG